MTAVAGAVYTAAQFNTFVRDNLNETCPAKATTTGSYFVTSGTNRIAERQLQQQVVLQQDGCTSTSYADPDQPGLGGSPAPVPGPSLTAFTGSQALIVVGGRIGGGTVSTQSVKMSWQVDGASSIAAVDTWAAGAVGLGSSGFAYDSRAWLVTGLTEGLNIFSAKYSVSSGTGYFSARSLLVMPF